MSGSDGTTKVRASGSPADGWPVGVAVFAGLTIKIAFMVLGWFMSVTFMPSFSPYFLVYFFVDDLLGAFVAGLVVVILFKTSAGVPCTVL